MHAHSDSSTGLTKSTATRSADSSWHSSSPETYREKMARKAKSSSAPDNPQLRLLHRVRESGDKQFVAALDCAHQHTHSDGEERRAIVARIA